MDVRTAGAFVHVTVSDDGPGIPAPSAEAVFGRGFRGPGSRGTGLGLAVARTLARQHGGELRLIPSAIGATFLLSLPRAGVTEMPNGARALTVRAVS